MPASHRVVAGSAKATDVVWVVALGILKWGDDVFVLVEAPSANDAAELRAMPDVPADIGRNVAAQAVLIDLRHKMASAAERSRSAARDLGFSTPPNSIASPLHRLVRSSRNRALVLLTHNLCDLLFDVFFGR